MNITSSPDRYEQVALNCKYPATLFGFSPREQEYWNEPLGWVSDLLKPERQGLDPAECQRLLRELLVLRVWNDDMAPRFRVDTWVAAEPLGLGEAVKPGELLAWIEPSAEAEEFRFARVRRWDAEGGILYLAHDNGGQLVALVWQAGYAPPAYRVTHYVNQQVPRLGWLEEEGAAGQPGAQQGGACE